MARVKISEYRAKSLLVGSEYRGISVQGKSSVPALRGQYVVKVDQGVKQRMKKGLLAVGVTSASAKKHIADWKKKGYSRFLIEPVIEHAVEDERYLSMDRVRGGILLSYSERGGIDIEEHRAGVQTFLIESSDTLSKVAQKIEIPFEDLLGWYELFSHAHVAFLEVNPVIVRDGRAIPLDAAILVDDTAEFFVRDLWSENDVIRTTHRHASEERVAALAETTPAALELTVVNPNARFFFLLSGGGGSITVVDELSDRGLGSELGNYGEYSGGPTREETYLYAREVIQLLLASKARRKALIIAGGIANFTDIYQTFLGIVDALRECADQMRAERIKVYVRRGGPHEQKGLELMRTFLTEHGILGSVHGSDMPITSPISDLLDTHI